MLAQTHGIVLNSVKYGENSLIISILTESYGLISFMVRRSKSKKSSGTAKIFSKLAILDIVYNHKDNKNIQHVSEASIHYHYKDINTNIVKSAILLFLDEILYKTIKEIEPNKVLFDFITESLIAFDTLDKGSANFHLYFLCRLMTYLGIDPQKNYDRDTIYFNIPESRFQNTRAASPYDMNDELSYAFYKLQTAKTKDLDRIILNAGKRKELLEYILLYYKLHHDNHLNIKSHLVLEQVFR